MIDPSSSEEDSEEEHGHHTPHHHGGHHHGGHHHQGQVNSKVMKPFLILFIIQVHSFNSIY